MAVHRYVITALVLVHLVASVWHGEAHSDLGIDLPPNKDAFIYLVIVGAPVVSAVLVWTRHRAPALWLFTLSMLGALLFGAYHHYVLVSPDNVAHLPAGPESSHEHFVDSAAAIAILEAAAVAYGAALLLIASGRSSD